MKKIVKKVFLSILILIVSLVVVVGGYCGYLVVSYERIGNVDLDVNSKALESTLKLNNKYSAVTYNIGFSAYSQDYTFFLDTGYDIDGNETCGYWSTARSEEESLINLNGSLNTVQELDLDFVLLQEVDINSTRSFNINQNQLFVDGFIVSDNIEIIENYNVITKNGNLGIDGFAFSDHQPAYIEFELE